MPDIPIKVVPSSNINGVVTSEYNKDISVESSSAVSTDVIINHYIGADVNIEGNIEIQVSGGGVSPKSNILYRTTAEWESMYLLIAEKGTIYVYSDHNTIDGIVYPGIKIGDGVSYLHDLPIITDYIDKHINNKQIHITQEERNSWNKKNRSYVDGTRLIFTEN